MTLLKNFGFASIYFDQIWGEGKMTPYSPGSTTPAKFFDILPKCDKMLVFELWFK